MKKFSKKLGAIILSLALVLVIAPVAAIFAGCGCTDNGGDGDGDGNTETAAKIYTAYKALSCDMSESEWTVNGEEVNIGDPWEGTLFGEEQGIAILYGDGTCVVSAGGVIGAGTYTDTTITVTTKNLEGTGEASYLFDGSTTLTFEGTEGTEGEEEFSFTISRSGEYIYSITGSGIILVLKEKTIDDSQNSLLGAYVTTGKAYEKGSEGADYYTPYPDTIKEIGEELEGIGIEYSIGLAVFTEDKIFINTMGDFLYNTYTINGDDSTLLDMYQFGMTGEYRPAKIQEDGSIWVQMGGRLIRFSKVDSVAMPNA